MKRISPGYIILVFILVVSLSFVIATTIVNDDGITTESINDIYIVDVNSGSDIQVKINLCTGTEQCTIIVPAGNYRVTSQIDFKDNVVLDVSSGANITTTVALFNITGMHNIQIIGGNYYGNLNFRFTDTGDTSNLIIKDIAKLDNFNAIQIKNTNNFTFSNNKEIMTKFGLIVSDHSYDGVISDNKFIETNGDDLSIDLRDGVHDITVNDNIDYEGISVKGTYDTHPEFDPVYNIYILNNIIGGERNKQIEDDGISIWGLGNGLISGNTVINAVEDCIIVRSQQGNASYDVQIVDNYCKNTTQRGIYSDQHGGLIQGNYIVDSGTVSNQAGITIENHYGNNNFTTIIGNYIKGSSEGMSINGSTFVSNNVILDSDRVGITFGTNADDSVVSFNLIDGVFTTTNEEGMYVNVDAHNMTFQGNTISDTNNRGLRIGINLLSDDNKVLNNNFYHYDTSAITDSGTNNKILSNFYNGELRYESNFTIQSGNGTNFNCGVTNGGTFVCS